VAHFLMKVMYCLFAEDVGLLPDQTFTKLINLSLFNPDEFQKEATHLFDLMRTGGRFGFDMIPHFNGGLFDNAPALPLSANDLNVLRRVAGDNQNWAGVEPSIFGTLFERLLDPRKRAQIGAHYTSKADILLVVEPVVMTPLRRKWQEIQANLADTIAKHDAEPNRKKREPLAAPITIAVEGFRRHLAAQRILDPACGSGNFLYVALQQLLDLEDQAVRFCSARDIPVTPVPYVRPSQLHGIEINPYAAELAQVVIWIGYLQWMHVHGIENPKRPILDKLQTIENRDAILDLSDKKNPVPAKWPEADFIIGNPPFLGTKMLRRGLGDEYVEKLFATYADRIPGFSDLCCYWFELGRESVSQQKQTRVGLLATQGIRGGENRRVLERVKEDGEIFLGWSDREWVLEGANVHVSIVGFDGGGETTRSLDGRVVPDINANLTSGADFTAAGKLAENAGIGFVADVKAGAFDVDWTVARKWLAAPNPNGRSSLDVVIPWLNGRDVTSRSRSMWIVDFGEDESIEDAARYQEPFEYVRLNVKPERDKVKRDSYRKYWWIHAEPCGRMRRAIAGRRRYLVTPTLTKHRLFAWIEAPALADHQLIAFARDDDYFFGICQSAIHDLWARAKGTQLREVESGFRYTPTTCFETFPMPWTPGKEPAKETARIAAAAKSLDEQRERWLNPPEWLEPLAAKIDAADTFADVPPEARPLVRRSAILAAAAKDERLKKRTLTNLYNERPTWLRLAHLQLDKAVLAAYAVTDVLKSSKEDPGEPASAGGSSPQWDESWAQVWQGTGPGQPLPAGHPLTAQRLEVDRRVLENLLRLNDERSR
ncbi:MAG: hypothetical protein JWN40_971, partial [Phycisphaerales bacterium]|nr:hypothetical protein [Phycisphaerales bacterium]